MSDPSAAITLPGTFQVDTTLTKYFVLNIG